MSLEKRTLHPMRRTTSISGISFDLNIGNEPWPSDSQDNSVCPALFRGGIIEGWDQRSVVASERVLHRRHSSELVDATHFLRICCLCKSRLFPGRDIYMGDSAFCSLECRQQQMNLDERKDKCNLAFKKLESASLSAAGSSNGETVAPV